VKVAGLKGLKGLLNNFQDCLGKCYSIIIIVNKNDRNIKSVILVKEN